MNQETIIGIIIAVAAAGFIAFMLYRRRQSKRTLNDSAARRQEIIDSLTDDSPAIPNAAPRILSRGLKLEVRLGILEGFRERIETARNIMGWSNGLNPADYTVLVFPSVRDINPDGIYSPVFQVFFEAGDAYDESQYDQMPNEPGGWTFAAEQVLTSNGEPINVFIIADNNSEEYSARATSYGLDHLLAFRNDRGLYEATKDHSSGTSGHPCWP